MRHFSIIVTFEPEIQSLKLICEALTKQSSTVVIVDNSERVMLQEIPTSNCIIIRNGKNMGIAAAQNIGIRHALSEGAEFLSFFDQDSEIEDRLLEKLLTPFCEFLYCVTAPVPINRQSGEEYPSHRLNRLGWPKNIFSFGSSAPCEVTLVISSGLTVSKEIIQNIGSFDEDFFIDFVDIEWCLRCYKKNIPIFIIPTAKMNHSIGDHDFLIGKMVCSLHSPERTYYKVRNSFLIMRKGAPILFSVRQLASAIIKNLIIVKKTNNKKDYLRYYFLGIRDGFLGKRGKVNLKYEK